MKWLRHQLDHLALGVLVFAAGVMYGRTHEYHHALLNRPEHPVTPPRVLR